MVLISSKKCPFPEKFKHLVWNKVHAPWKKAWKLINVPTRLFQTITKCDEKNLSRKKFLILTPDKQPPLATHLHLINDIAFAKLPASQIFHANPPLCKVHCRQKFGLQGCWKQGGRGRGNYPPLLLKINQNY